MTEQTSLFNRIVANWSRIPSVYRLMLLVMIYMFAYGIVMVFHYNNPANNFIVETIHFDVLFISAGLILLSALVPLGYYLTSSLVGVAVLALPVLGLDILLFFQVAQSPTAPLQHLLNALFVIVLFVVLFHQVRENVAEREAHERTAAEKLAADEVNQRLYARIERLQSQLQDQNNQQPERVN